MVRENLQIKMHDESMRKVRIALPDGYKESEERFPVLYMFDGQNLFDREDSFAGVLWDVEKAADKLMKEKKIRPMIIIGIDNAGERRLDEYGPWPFATERYSSKGEGKMFAEFLIQKILPELEKRYPISRKPEDRFLAGSSMGALMTAYIGARYPGLFSALGIFSLSSWVSEEPFLEMIHGHGMYKDTRFFIQVGTEERRDEKSGAVDYVESQRYLDNSLNYLKAIASKGASLSKISMNIAAGKTHNEEAWASFMPQFLEWLSD